MKDGCRGRKRYGGLRGDLATWRRKPQTPPRKRKQLVNRYFCNISCKSHEHRQEQYRARADMQGSDNPVPILWGGAVGGGGWPRQGALPALTSRVWSFSLDDDSPQPYDTMAPTSSTPTARALAAKEQGNAHFKAKDYAQAVGASRPFLALGLLSLPKLIPHACRPLPGCYSQAHLLDPKSPIYPLNRAQAYLNLLKSVVSPCSSTGRRSRLTPSSASPVVSRYDDAERDCTTSIGLDGTNSKAWFRRAVARREMKDFEGAARGAFPSHSVLWRPPLARLTAMSSVVRDRSLQGPQARQQAGGSGQG